MVCEEYVCEVKCFLGILLRHRSARRCYKQRSATCLSYGLQAPGEGNKGEC